MGLASIIRGHGRDVIALHGGPGLSHTYLRGPLKPLEGSFTVHYVDHLGHGASPREPPYTLANLARAVTDYAEKHTPDGSVLMGHSMGGAVALMTASTSPDLVRGLVLVSTVVRTPSFILRGDPVVKARFAGKLARHALRGDAREIAVADAIRVLDPVLSTRRGTRARDVLVASITPPVACLYPLLAEAARLRIMRLLPRVRVPSLVIVGDADPFAHPDARVLARRLPRGSLRVVPGAGHHLILEYAGEVVSASRAFIERLAPASHASSTSYARSRDDDVVRPSDRHGLETHPSPVGSDTELPEREAVTRGRADRVRGGMEH